MQLRDDIKIGSNVRLRLMDRPNGHVVEERESHNIFINYGREWISELIAYNAGTVPFRGDRVRWIGVGIGGTQQSIPYLTVQGMGYAGFANDWQYGLTLGLPDLTKGGEGGTGTAGPTQDDITPAITGLEYPVQISSDVFYDSIKMPATFPEAGTVRFTAVLGYVDVSYGAYTAVPLSEIGLFTGSATEGVIRMDYPPLDATESREVPPTSGNYYPPVGTRFMIAYNTFPTLVKTSAFVLQIDWELRFA